MRTQKIAKSIVQRIVKSIMIMGLVLSGLASRADEVLYWMLDNPTITDMYYTKYNLADRSTTMEGNEMVFARVAAFQDQAGDNSYEATRLDGGFSGAGDIVYLDLYFPGEDGEWTLDIPNNTIAIIGASGEPGTVKPSERASIAASLEAAGKIPGVSIESFSFAVELGTYDDDGNWVLAAISHTETYAALTGYISQQLDIPDTTRWAPNAFAAPEPSSGLLTLIGLALLGLKRKKV